MRIAGHIEHPEFKITILHMNHRYALKFERGGIEQTYKIRESEHIQSAEEIKGLVNETVLETINLLFNEMESARIAMLVNGYRKEKEIFEELI